MPSRAFSFTSESVTEGHPDKMADQISDSVLDAVLAADSQGRVACETLITTGLVVVAGEITTETYVDIPQLVRRRGREIGYPRAKFGLDCDTLLKPDLIEHVIEPILPKDLYDQRRLEHRDFVYCNPTGKFVIGGPMGDTGLTGRKIIVDTYGGAAPHGGGAFSGKDPTKVDRSAAYAARYLAKNVVAAGLAERCTIQLSYAIGVAKPLSVYVETHGTGAVAEDRMVRVLCDLVDLSPRGIREHLGLNR